MIILLVLIFVIPVVLVAIPYKGGRDAQPVGNTSVNPIQNMKNDNENGPYPYIFVHGMTGWGENSKMNEKMPYWGFSKEQDLMKYLRDEGNEVYAPSVGPLSSAYDRACELYAQLTGTRVDYGESHSKKYGHERYGRDYTGSPIMGTPWDMNKKINLVGHSFGGPTIRVLTSLLAYGSKEETDASGDECSPLFKGGNAGGINAVITLASPNNGTPLANFLNDPIVPSFTASVAMNIISKKDVAYDPMLTQWGFEKTDLLNDLKLAVSKDQCGYDMTLNGASVLNKKFPTVPDVYYISYAASLEPYEDSTNKILTSLWKFVRFAGSHMIIDGRIPGDEWGENDGFVPVFSAQYPDSDENNYVNFVSGSEIQKGVYTVMPVNESENHGYYCSPCGDPEEFHRFFNDMIKTVNQLD